MTHKVIGFELTQSRGTPDDHKNPNRPSEPKQDEQTHANPSASKGTILTKQPSMSVEHHHQYGHPALPPQTPYLDFGLAPRLKSARTVTRVYLDLLERRRCGEPNLGMRIRQQSIIVCDVLQPLGADMRQIEDKALSRRRRTWGIGVVAYIVSWGLSRLANAASSPSTSAQIVKRGLSMPSSRFVTASLILASFSTLYIFQNELAVRVSRDTARQLHALADGLIARNTVVSDVYSDAVAKGDAYDFENSRVLEGWQWDLLKWRE
ncbi:hypothetical protein F503_04032 [Ophiostoma piceae UAMH 11346]|uniref:Uncharacterized protein n=1 Tax=Ophiostoma piceae (strain UAMH 11346) TaxID=1262450 RepID=S3C902_OPHP1|nr:hypothetical protein F503_04032 [Ophiostoma piceae UAMH 11346]